jgi:hypothetical protein
MGVYGQLHAPAALPPGKRPGTHCTGVGWAPGPIWAVAENLAPTGIRFPDRRTRSDRYTDYAIPVHEVKNG